MEEPDLPWLTKEFLTECLKHEDSHEDVQVREFSTSLVVPPGNNYGSCVTRVRVLYKQSPADDTHSTSLVIKSEVTDGIIKEWLDDIPGIPVESLFYKKFLFTASQYVDTSFAPKSYFSSSNNITVLEDLKETGFKMVDRAQQLDYEHCVFYIEAAASFHAASVLVHKKDPKLIEALGVEKMFNQNTKFADDFKRLIAFGLKTMVSKINNLNNLEKYRKYCTIINEVSPCLWDMLVDAHKPSKLTNTINQGDPWITNMMFKYDDQGKVKAIKLLDFQMLRWASPVNDLVFFFWTSAKLEVRKNKLPDLYQHYIDVFNKHMEKLNHSERLNYEDVMDNVKILSSLVVYLAFYYPLLLNPEPVDFAALLKNENDDEVEVELEKYYTEEYCNYQLPQLLEAIELAGVFEYFGKQKYIVADK